MALVIPAVTKISSRVIRVLGCNPGPTTLQGTNTYIVGTGKRRILIDTGEADVPQYINHLRNVLKYEQIDLAHIFLTHWHPDHAGGVQDILDELKEYTEYCQVWKFPWQGDENIYDELEYFKDGTEFSVEGATIRVIHTPGHTMDHVSFHLLEDNAIFSGDCIMGEGTAVFEDLNNYIESLQELSNIESNVIYPGHGNVVYDPQDRISFYLSHRLEREEQIVEVLSSNRKRTFSENELVSLIYQGLPEILIKSAEFNVSHHLTKLLKEDKVKRSNDLWQYNGSEKNIF